MRKRWRATPGWPVCGPRELPTTEWLGAIAGCRALELDVVSSGATRMRPAHGYGWAMHWAQPSTDMSMETRAFGTCHCGVSNVFKVTFEIVC
jgi:hypothetical protein